MNPIKTDNSVSVLNYSVLSSSSLSSRLKRQNRQILISKTFFFSVIEIFRRFGRINDSYEFEFRKQRDASNALAMRRDGDLCLVQHVEAIGSDKNFALRANEGIKVYKMKADLKNQLFHLLRRFGAAKANRRGKAKEIIKNICNIHQSQIQQLQKKNPIIQWNLLRPLETLRLVHIIVGNQIYNKS